VLRDLLASLVRRAWRATGAPRPDGRAPQAPGTLRELFESLLWSERYEQARALAEDALARDPASYEAQLLVGRAHQKLHRPERALEYFKAARHMRPDDAELHDFLGSLYQELGRLPEAFAEFDRALALRPDFALAAFHRAMARLLAGDFERGWDDYELRRLNAAPVPGAAGVPRWDGSALAGRTILVSREQGLGDEIMFASILPQLMTLAGHCVVECDPRLLATFRRSFPAATIAASMPEVAAWTTAPSLTTGGIAW